MPPEDQGATPVTPAQNPTATVTPPAQTVPNQGVTPPIQIDTANRIATLENERDSGNARIRELNAENKNHRLLDKALVELGIKPDGLAERLKTLEAYEKLGKPDEMTSRLQTLESQAADGRKLRVEAIADGAGYKASLADFAEKFGFGIAQRDAKDKDDKPVKEAVAVTKGADGKAVETPLGEFLKTNYVDYLPALQKAQQQQFATRGASPTPDPAENQQRAPQQPRAIGFL